MENKNILNNHSVEDHTTYLVVHLGDEYILVTPQHKETMQEVCDYLDCINLMIPLVADQSDCICKQEEKIAKLDAENQGLQKRLAELGTEKNELFIKLDDIILEKTELTHKIEAYKDANARLGEQVKELKLEKQCIEDVNAFNEQCRQMHLDAIRKDLDEAIAEKRVMAIKIDDLQNRINNQESLIKRLRAVAERECNNGFKVARELVELKQQLRDVGDWIETVVNPEAKDE